MNFTIESANKPEKPLTPAETHYAARSAPDARLIAFLAYEIKMAYIEGFEAGRKFERAEWQRGPKEWESSFI